MRTLSVLSGILITVLAATVSLQSQDMFPVQRLTSDSAQEGFPSWSPDGKTIVYSFYNIVEGKHLHGSRKIPSAGGTPVLFTDFPTEHPQWSPDGRLIVFDADMGAAIRLIPATGGSQISFLPDSLHIDKGGLPCWSASGSQIAFKEETTSSLCVYDLGTRQVVRIFREDGKIPLPGCWSREGKNILVALMDRQSRVSTMWRISSDGTEKQQVTGHHERFYRFLALSPDGTLLVYAAMGEKRLGLWVMPAEGGKSLPLILSSLDHNESPAWSPDGKHLAFASSRTGRGDIYVMELDMDHLRRELSSVNK
jgi:Tol biopolymer transport system component